MNTLVQISVGNLVGLAFVGGALIVGFVVCLCGWVVAATDRDVAKQHSRFVEDSLAKAKLDSEKWFGKYMATFGK